MIPGPEKQVWRPDLSSQSLCALSLPDGATLFCSTEYVHVRLANDYAALSSAILNGGLARAMDFLNIKVDSSYPGEKPPGDTVEDYSRGLGCDGTTVGMMTAASMKSLRVVIDDGEKDAICVVVTTGLENARCAGDPADYCSASHLSPPAGTINLAVILGFPASLATLVEMTTVAVEAKAVALQRLGVASPVTGETATGTGTDAIAFFTPELSPELLYAGKHTRLGERLAQAVIEAITDSVGSWQR